MFFVSALLTWRTHEQATNDKTKLDANKLRALLSTIATLPL